MTSNATTMIDFTNTTIAFAYKSNRELKRAFLLFTLLKSPILVKAGKVLTNIAIHLHLPIRWLIKPTIYKHFCGGETIKESMPVIRKIEQFGVRGILDYSVEGKESIDEIQAALEETLRTIRNAGKDQSIPFAVFKPTAFIPHRVLNRIGNGEVLSDQDMRDKESFRERVRLLCQTAFEHDIPIMIDAEDSWYQEFIDEVVIENMELFNKKKAIVYNTLQMYRTDRLIFLQQAWQKAVADDYYLGIKFVRGAYMEKERARAAAMGYPDPINPDKPSTDKMYDDGLRFTVAHIDRISVFNGSHNEASNQLLCELMEKHGLENDDPRIWFSQLFGMSDHISFNLGAQGYNVAKYLPYGPVQHVLPYLIRRAEENTAVAGQTLRELNLVRSERAWRKKMK